MNYLKSKSEFSRDAAAVLQKQTYYSSVIHCAYYSCVQLMKHILIYKLGKSEEEIYREQKATDANGKLLYSGVHDYLIKFFLKELTRNGKDGITFNKNIVQLKKLRTQADYEDVLIDIDKGKNSIILSDIVLKNLKDNFRP